MPINIAIPVNDASLADRTGAKVTRAEGDPGTYEHFVLPTHLYIYLVVTSMDGTKTTVLTPEGMDVAGGYRLKPENWVKVTTSDYQKDSVYTYTGKIGIIIPEDRSAGVVYAAMSSVPITVSYTGNDVANAGFIKEGFSRQYLRIGGKTWKDHERWAVLNEQWVDPLQLILEED